MIPLKAIFFAASVTFLGTLFLMLVLGFTDDPGTEPGPAFAVAAWVLGTVMRAGGGYVAGRMSVRTGSRGRVVGAGAIAGAVGYTLFLSLMAALAALGGNPGFSLGDVLGLPVWTAQATLGGALAILLHHGRIASESRASSWGYG